jgi:anti-sigma B factor antagonist/stage II sporulation protein AA (anti-sigma F factor antagonist)
MLTITDRRDGGLLTLSLDGELDLSTHADLAAALDKAIATAETAEIMVDCARLRFCDSTGVHTLLMGHRRADAEGVTIRLIGVRGIVARVLTICGALTILTDGQPAA